MRARTYGRLQSKGTQWLVYMPRDTDNPDSPCTESAFTGHSNARHALTVARACVALSLLGLLTKASIEAVATHSQGQRLAQLVYAGIAAAGAQHE